MASCGEEAHQESSRPSSSHPLSPRPLVVVGGGIAGVACIQLLASECPSTPLILISASPLIKVAKNLKSYGHALEDFDVTQESAQFLQNSYSNIRVISAHVTKLNASLHELLLDDGNIIKYRKLCICSGAKPQSIPVTTELSPYVLVIRDTQTVHDFQLKLAQTRRVLIVGNGGIATEIVYEIKNCCVVWVVRQDSIGSTFFDAGAAQFFIHKLNDNNDESDSTPISKRLKYTQSSDGKEKNEMGAALGPDWSLGLQMKGSSNTKNVVVEYNCEVDSLYRHYDDVPDDEKSSVDQSLEGSWPVFVKLTNGKIYGCDFIVSATGVTPNSSVFLDGNHFNVGPDGGISVNSEMMTSEEDVYAAGDVCSVDWDLATHWFQMRLWTQAHMMGVYAARCIACHLKDSSPLLYFNFENFTHVTKFFGFKVVLLGLFNGQKLDNDYEALLRVIPKQEYIKVILKDGKMQGAILIGETDLEETFENLILNQIDLSPYGEDLLNNTIDIEDYFD